MANGVEMRLEDQQRTNESFTRFPGTTQQLLQMRDRFYKFARHGGLIGEKDGDIISSIKKRVTLDPNGKMYERLANNYGDHYWVDVELVPQDNGSNDFAILSTNSKTGETDSYILVINRSGITIDIEGIRVDLQEQYSFKQFEDGFIHRIVDYLHQSDVKSDHWETRSKQAAEKVASRNNQFLRGKRPDIRRGPKRYS